MIQIYIDSHVQTKNIKQFCSENIIFWNVIQQLIECQGGYQGNAGVVTKEMLGWLPRKCQSGYQNCLGGKHQEF